MNKKIILDNIYYNLGRQHTDFKIFGLLSKNIGTKWKKYSEVCFPLNLRETSLFLEKVNNRTICENEIVLDIEDKNNIDKIIERLKKLTDCDIFVYDTGSRGIHVHLWDKNPTEEKLKEELIQVFKADTLKLTGKPIALENVPHWKTGKIKRLIWTKNNL